MALALLLGISLATENYVLLIFAATVVTVVILVIMPGSIPLFVFGILMPFSLPVPFIWNFPFLMIALAICGVKFWLQRGLQQRLNHKFLTFSGVDIPIGLFFTWVFIRYCMKPVFPNVMGFGNSATGFRSWLSYGLSFGVLFYTGRFIASRAGVVKLMRWLMNISILFTLVFVPVTLSKSAALALLFFRLGMFVNTFDNGMLRFVVLPEFGLFLLSLILLPNLLKLGRVAWWSALILGSIAVVLGGNRSGLGMAFILVTVIPLLRRKFMLSAITAASVLAVSATAYFAGPALSKLPYTGALRALGLVSPELSDVTGGDSNMEWREVLWQRAIEEIRTHPFIGEGYGGVENMYESNETAQDSENTQDLLVATGGVHNGYIAGALVLGIPAAILFICIQLHHIILNTRRAFAFQKNDPLLGEAHCFVCAHLLAYVGAIFIGSDLNYPLIWFYFGLSLFLVQLRARERQVAKAAPAFAQPFLSAQTA